jgi:hypothetical protein
LQEHSYFTLLCCHCGHEISVPQYCGNRFCRVCGVARRRRTQHRIAFMISKASPRPGETLKHLTLTVPNTSDPKTGLKDCLESFRRLRSRRWWRNNVSGGAYVIEITGQENSWHVHIHAVIYAQYLPFVLLKTIWTECSPGNHVYINRITKDRAVGYLTKYITKASVSDEHLDSVSDAFKGRRLFSPFGSFHSLPCPPALPPYACPDCGNGIWAPQHYFNDEGRHSRSYRAALPALYD